MHIHAQTNLDPKTTRSVWTNNNNSIAAASLGFMEQEEEHLLVAAVYLLKRFRPATDGVRWTQLIHCGGKKS